ncbi:MAG: outer membrane lipoprotein-sorting protein [bacterium]|nr:outer membrane lipoprotein-sorting protein [bacterium]
MKHKNLLLLMVLAFLLPTFSARGAALPKVREILKKTEANEILSGIYRKMTLVAVSKEGVKRRAMVQSWTSQDGDRRLMEYIPYQGARTKVLIRKKEKEIFVLASGNPKWQKLSESMIKQKIERSNFSYEDVSPGTLSSKYTGRTLRIEKEQGVDCYLLSLRPRSTNSAYTRVVMWIGTKDFLRRRVDFIKNNESTPFKRLRYKDVKEMGGRKVQGTVVMLNLVHGSKTFYEVREVKFKQNFEDFLFKAQ